MSLYPVRQLQGVALGNGLLSQRFDFLSTHADGDGTLAPMRPCAAGQRRMDVRNLDNEFDNARISCSLRFAHRTDVNQLELLHDKT
jgi:hypothetical protein